MSAFWLKPEDRVRPEWFRPLEQLAELVACEPALPQVNPDHFFYAARILRDGHPDLHAYRHVGTRKYINVDDAGDLWRFARTDEHGIAVYTKYEAIEDAVEAAELRRGNLLTTHLRSGARTGDVTAAAS
jgi:hypothetical protein